MSGNFYEIDEILNEAVMTGIPAIIVEGVDDISIYSKLSTKLPFDVEVYAIENIEGYDQGCEQVILAIKELNLLENSRYQLDDHVLGVIDKDVRDYRGELPSVGPILTLEHYSIESYFVSRDVVMNILFLCMKASKNLITDKLCDVVFNEVESGLRELYYFSLESLRASLEPDYESLCFYSYPTGRFNDVNIKGAIQLKIAELDIFALSLGISPSLMTLKSISKGKWLIDLFATELIKSISFLNAKCVGSEIVTCQFCITGAPHKCLYRLKDGINNKAIKSLALSFIDGPDFNYIIDRISSIKKIKTLSA